MSADAADLDNDGRDELYIAQIAMGTVSQMAKQLAAPVSSCEIYPDLAERTRCDQAARFQVASIDARNLNSIEPCMALGDALQRRDCVVTAHHWFRVLARLPALGADKRAVMEECAKIPADFTARDVADHRPQPDGPRDLGCHLRRRDPSVKHANLLFSPEGFRDVTAAWKARLRRVGWSARFADLDNDGFQDSTSPRARGCGRVACRRPSTGTRRARASATTRAFGLEGPCPTGSYVYLDVDGGGDLDLITHPFQLTGPLAQRRPEGTGFASPSTTCAAPTAGPSAPGCRSVPRTGGSRSGR
jgi:hypothetical protein